MAKYDREILKGASEGGMISPTLILGGRHQLLIGRVPEGYELTVVNVPLSSPRDPLGQAGVPPATRCVGREIAN